MSAEYSIHKNIHYREDTHPHIKRLLVVGECLDYIGNVGVKCELTDNHSCTDVTKLGFLAVVVFKLVWPVIDLNYRLRGRRGRGLFFLHLFIIHKINLRRTESELCVHDTDTRTETDIRTVLSSSFTTLSGAGGLS